jgi:hypothetical protein
MPVERKVIGTDPNGQPIYAGDPQPPGQQAPVVTVRTGPDAGTQTTPPQSGGKSGGGDKDNPWDFTRVVTDPGGFALGASKSLTDPQGFINDITGGFFSTPNTYPAAAELAKSEAMAGNVYQGALSQAGNIIRSGAPSSVVTAERLAAPAAISAQQVATPGLVGGAEASDLRTAQLAQAERAANSPSAAAAQMRASAGLIGQQQLGQAAAARGADRAAAKRDAMLATGSQGMVAANQASALAAQEQAAKQQAYTQALAGVRSGDVAGTQALTDIAGRNQAANLQAQQSSAANTLQAGMANQGADLEASKFTAGQELQAWQAQQAALNAAYGTGLQAVGAQNQAQGVAAGYGTGQNQLQQENKGGLASMAGSVIRGLSDERAKADIMPMQTGGGIDFLDWEYHSPQVPSSDSGSAGMLSLGTAIGSVISDERAKASTKRLTAADETADLLRSAYGITDDGNPYAGAGPMVRDVTDDTLADDTDLWLNGLAEPDTTQAPMAGPNASDYALPETPLWNGGYVNEGDTVLSDERTKREVDRMGLDGIADFTRAAPAATFRFKPGVDGAPDNGERYRAGTIAQDVKKAGPLGKMFVNERPDGLLEVEYGPMAHFEAKGAQATADKALALALAAYSGVMQKGVR